MQEAYRLIAGLQERFDKVKNIDVFFLQFKNCQTTDILKPYDDYLKIYGCDLQLKFVSE